MLNSNENIELEEQISTLSINLEDYENNLQ